jgi:hypothetical protein
MLENGLSVAGIAALALSYRRFRFSRVSYAMMLVFSPCTSADSTA